MPSDWPTATLGELTLNLDTRRKPVKEADRRAGPYPYYGASGIVDHVEGYLFEGEHLLIAEDGENLRTRNTPVAFRATGRFWVNNHAHIVTGNERARTRFLEYAVLAADLTPYLTGAVMPKLTQGNLNKIQIPCPSLSEQDAVIGVLGALDDRIDLLRHTNATLESIAQALFKSWFIDFDPVRAKAEGREPEGMDAATAALFPAEFEESALGFIPKGSTAGMVEDLFVLQRGFDLPATQRTDGLHTVFSASGPHGTHTEAMAKGPGVVTGRSGVIGKVFFAHEDYWPLNTALWVKEFKRASPAFAFQFLKTMDLMRLNAGSAVPSLNRNHVHAQPAIIPSAEQVAAFTAVAMPLLQRIRANEAHASQLCDVRDTLLPRLISGKLRLPEAQSMMEFAA